MRSVRLIFVPLAFACWGLVSSGLVPRVQAATSISATGVPDPLADYVAKERALDEAWDKMPMAARRVRFVKGPVKRYGGYEPRDDNLYKTGETVISYIEPIGFVFRDVGYGLFAYGFRVGLRVTRPDGSELMHNENYATLDSRSRARNHDVEFSSSIGIKGLAPGAYTLEFDFRDLNSDKSMKVKQTFQVEG